MKRILLFNDSKFRDLPGTVLLKHHLERLIDNALIIILPYGLWNEAINLFNPHLVVLNHIQGKRNQMIASHVKRHGGVVAVLFNEGIIEFESKAEIFSGQKGHKHVDLFLCWNDIVADLVDGVVVGCPRFDIYTQHQELIDSKALFCAKYNLDKDKPIILFGDSWPSAKFSYSMQNFHRTNWSDLDNTKADKWSDADEFAKTQFEFQEKFKLIILNVLHSFPDVQVVVKSHPMSDYIRWAKWCDEHGVTLIHGEYIFNALNASDVFVTKTGSITVAEAWMLNIPTIKLWDDYDSASSLEQYEADSLNAHGDSEVIEWVGSLLRYELSSVNDIKRNEYLDRWGIGNARASSDTAKAIKQLIDERASEVLGDFDLDKLVRTTLNFDNRFSGGGRDSFGNWDKTTLQRDVQEWQTRLSSA